MKRKITLFLMTVLMLSLLTIPAFASCDDCIAQEEALFAANPDHCSVNCTGDHYEICNSCGDNFLFELCGSTHQYTYTHNNGTHTGVCACGKTDTGTCSFELISTTPSTCQTKGYESWLCKTCDTPKTVMLPLGDHSYPMEATDVHLATCTTAGYTEWLCETCDHIKETDHYPALGHDWDEVTTNATCEAKGIHYKVCKRCALDESEEIPALGHAWADEWTSCTSTCYFAGKAIYGCTVCGDEETRAMDMLPHEYVNGKCTMCLKLEDTAEPDLPQGSITPGGSSGSSGTSGGGFDLPDFDMEIRPQQLLGILSVAAVVLFVIWVIVKKKDNGRRR